MKIFVPRETTSGELRVAATPETVGKMVAHDWAVVVESGAGAEAGFSDSAFEAAGADIVDKGQGWSTADVVLKVGPLAKTNGEEEAELPPAGSTVIGLLAPHQEKETMRRLAERNVHSLALELLPRTTLAQSMDALSSQASIAGYKAVLLAAGRLDRYFPLLMTAAGTIPPARVVVMGAGVAGLQAVATAKRLGAVVEVSDIRPAVKEEVESLGGRFIDLPLEESGEGTGGYAKEMTADFLQRQREILKEHVAAADVVITTAQVPGKRAPILLDREMVSIMKPGAVVIDLAAAGGGNCELTQVDEEVQSGGVTILGPGNLPASMAHDASVLYSRNVLALLEHAVDEDGLSLDRDDEILAGALLTFGGQVVHPSLAELKEEQSAEEVTT
jgi:NAD(P) transhydrogenase subunit alpha